MLLSEITEFSFTLRFSVSPKLCIRFIMKLIDILCPPLADLRQIRATSYWHKEEVKELGRRIEKVYGQLAHERAVEEVFLQLAARYQQIMRSCTTGRCVWIAERTWGV